MAFTIENRVPITADQIARVDASIAEAEKTTSGEIVAVLAHRSSIYWHAPYESGIWGAGIAILLATAVSLVFWHEWPVWHIGWYVGITGAGFLAGFFLARLNDDVQRFFADEAIMKAECEEKAAQMFTQHRVYATAARTGVLLYVSLFEHMVIVLGDGTISEKLGPIEYQAIVASVISRIKQGALDQGLIDGIKMLGTHLTAHFPPSPNDINELPDKLYVIA